MHRIHLVTAALCVAAGIASSALPALADPGRVVARATVAPSGAAIARDKAPSGNAPMSTTKPPAGYVRVESAPFSVPGDIQGAGSVTCPGKKVPLGGGVSITSADLNANINSSYPSGKNWVADVNNGSAATTTFTVYAICANKPAGYQVVHPAPVTDAAGTQKGGFATCPGAKVPWSGGVFSTSGSLGANVNSSYPTGDTSHVWNVFMNNSSSSDTSFTPYAVCAARPHLYGQSFGTGTSNPASQDSALGTCGQGQVVVGGGDYSSASSVFVNVNSTLPYTSTTWRTWVNDNTANSDSFLAYATCVGL